MLDKLILYEIIIYIYSEAVLTSTHNLCFGAKIRKKVYPCKPQFYYINVGCQVFVSAQPVSSSNR